MLSIILREIDPGVSSVVGADIPQADEYDSCFLSLTPQLSLILNIDWEHVDMFPDKKAVKKHFTEFCRRLKPGGTLIYCGESESAHAVASEFMAQGKIPDDDAIGEVISYGLEDKNMWQAVMIKPNAYGGSDYLATYNGEVMTPVQIQLPGIHNVLNSLAAIAAAVVVASWKNTDDGKLLANIRKHISETAARSLYSFQGVHRRLEFVGKLENCHFYDDYAHHPTEISASLKAAREKFGNSSIWVIFQPQDYSRVSRLSKDFAVALAAADRVIVTQIYAARGKTAGGVSGQDIVDQIMGTSALYIQSMDDVYVFLSAELSTLLSSGQKDTLVVITMGTGSCTNLGPRLLQRFMS
ncbi:hypothetical protein KP509_04G065100 [Ceratopteris richardii]|uniref:UDP-N-acetylmuramate--L-alanine ligase n=1 Tax=Ceratopteris richardii TaxID=49495 RepID=A0A8T2V148_CERRI|nr:hypothetical protein KP509_04G065100 [Ceratopteris richardii]